MDPAFKKTQIYWTLHGAALLLTVAARLYETYIKQP